MSLAAKSAYCEALSSRQKYSVGLNHEGHEEHEEKTV